MRIASTVLDLIGHTPLVRLNRVTAGLSAQVVAKVEYVNPGGSVKDRIAVRIIDAAEASGDLQPGGTIVEPTSGNTGVGLALVAQQRGYRCVFVVPDKVGEDKRAVLRAYGAEVVVTPTAVAPEDPRSYYSVSDRIVRETPGAFKPNQYANPNGPASHYASTGPEIWDATDGRLTHFVTGVGTGGTISGTGRFLKDASKGAVRVIGADPEGSVYSGGTGRPYLEGVGEDFWPGAYDPTVVDEVEAVSDAESFAMTLRLAREEGLLVGGSSGMAVVAALRVAERLGPDDLVVVLLPDGGRGYLGKIFNDDWMASYGFGPVVQGVTVADLLAAKRSSDAPDLLAVRPEDRVSDAIGLMRRHGVSQLLVLGAEQPVVMGEVVGTVDERRLVDHAFSEAGDLHDAVGPLVGPPPPLIGAHESLATARTALASSDALLVTVGGKPVGVLTRSDLLAFVSEAPQGAAHR